MLKHVKKVKILSKKEWLARLQEAKKKPKTTIFLYITIMLAGCGLLFFGLIYIIFLAGLPSIDKLESNVLPESSVIYDRNGKELYALYNKEKRTYMELPSISKHVQDALISAEDKTFFENSGFDIKGIVRSGLNYVTGRTDRVQGTSTISQQLIKNTFLTNERSFSRKIKEVWLSYRLNSKYSKEKILELYLNKISFGNNAYGIEEASKTYFGKPSKNVGVLGASVLASLPKGPTYYSPYSHRDRLMGSLYIYDVDAPENKETIEKTEQFNKYKSLVSAFKSVITDMKIEKVSEGTANVCGLDARFFKSDIKIDKTGCSRMAYSDLLPLLNAIRIPLSSLSVKAETDKKEGVKVDTKATKKGKEVNNDVKTNEESGSGEVATQDPVLEYNTGRKDFVLGRMFEDEKITAEEYKNAIVGGLDFQFKKYAENIKYPHFVFYVKEYLENKYGKDFDSEGGLKIYTTLDSTLQDKAEEVVNKQVAINKKQYGATSAALVSLDNKTGQILSMVGGADYFSEDAGANVNVITSRRQPGSSFKPIVYSLAISKQPIGPETPVYDVDTKFGGWNPDNYDQKFMGRMPVKKALDYSRNIPAAKMFYMAGGEDEIVKYVNSMGVESLKLGQSYGAPMAIGTAELKPIELANAYMTFANYGMYKEVTPILKIEDKNGNIIEQYTKPEGKQVISAAATYILSTILSDTSSRPSAFWNNVLTLKDRVVAAKTGTSNKDVSKGGKKKILPRDLWTAGYTPQITTVVWAGNVDGSETKGTCDGLNCAAPIWRDYMNFAHQKLPKETFKRPEGVYNATISKISGKLVGTSTPDELRVSSIFAVKPTEYENSLKEVEVDMLCNGKVTDRTPESAIKRGYSVNIDPIIDSYDPKWLPPIRSWLSGSAADVNVKEYESVVLQASDKPCDRPESGDFVVQVSSTLENNSSLPAGKTAISIFYQSDNPVIKLQVLVDGKIAAEVPVDKKTVGDQKVDVDLTKFTGNQTITLRAYDTYYYAGSISREVTVGSASSSTTSTGSTGVSTGTLTPEFTTPPSSAAAPKDASLTISLTNPASGKSSIFNDQYVNLRWKSNTDKEIVSNVYVDGKLSKILSGGPDFVYAFNSGKDLEPGKYVIKLELVDENGKKSSKEVSIEVMRR